MTKSFGTVYVAGVRVSENTYSPEQYKNYDKKHAIWVDTNYSDITVTADDARKLATALVEAADAWDKDYAEYEESLKPKLPTKKNALIKFKNTYAFVISPHDSNEWIASGSSDFLSADELIKRYGSDFIVLFEGEDY